MLLYHISILLLLWPRLIALVWALFAYTLFVLYCISCFCYAPGENDIQQHGSLGSFRPSFLDSYNSPTVLSKHLLIRETREKRPFLKTPFLECVGNGIETAKREGFTMTGFMTLLCVSSRCEVNSHVAVAYRFLLGYLREHGRPSKRDSVKVGYSAFLKPNPFGMLL